MKTTLLPKNKIFSCIFSEIIIMIIILIFLEIYVKKAFLYTKCGWYREMFVYPINQIFMFVKFILSIFQRMKCQNSIHWFNLWFNKRKCSLIKITYLNAKIYTVVFWLILYHLSFCLNLLNWYLNPFTYSNWFKISIVCDFWYGFMWSILPAFKEIWIS